VSGTNWYAYGLLLVMAGLGLWSSRCRAPILPRAGEGAAPRDDGATVGIQAVGWMGVSPPLMKVFVDDRVVGILKDRSVHDFGVRPGRHEFMLARDWYKSETIALTLAPGDRLDLVGGSRAYGLGSLHELCSMAILGVTVVLVILFPSLTESAWRWGPLVGASYIPYLIWSIRLTFRPGGFLYLDLLEGSRV